MTVSGQTFEVPDEAFAETPMGPNPYFPEEQDASAKDPATDPTGAENAPPVEGQEEGSPDPTFDVEADRAAGLNVDSPEYKRFAEAFARKAAPKAPERDLAAEMDALRAEQAKADIARDTTPAEQAPETPAYKVDWNGFTVAKAPEDSPIHGVEDEISRQVRQHVEYAIGRVNQQNAEYTRVAKLTQTRDYLNQVVEEIGHVGGSGKQQEAMALLKQYLPIAKSDPVGWARFVVSKLGIPTEAPAKAPASAPTGDPQKVARQVKSSATRPTGSGRTTVTKPEFKGPNATRDAIAWALDHS
jgi:hypothetical protein